MQEFQVLRSKYEKIEKAYENFKALNQKLIELGIDQTPLAEELNKIMEKFNEIQKTAHSEMNLLDTFINEFNQGDIGLDQFSRRVSTMTSKLADVTFKLDMDVSPKLLRLSKKLAVPVIEDVKSVQEGHPALAQEAKNLENKMNEANKEPDVVEKMDKTLSLVDKAIEIGKKVYPFVKEYAPKIAPFAGLFI